MNYAIFCGREGPYLDICMRSILKADSTAAIHVLRPGDGQLMVEKCKAWLGHLLVHDEPVVFLDDDIIVQRQLSLPAEMDVILTHRNVEGLHPYNTGVVWANGKKALPFFDEVLKHCESLPDDRKDWYGDQDAVEAVAAEYPHAEVECDVWNWTPEHFGQLRQELKDPQRAVIHFKGNRKGWMLWTDKEAA